jgi:hypothetical protein
MRYNDAMRVLVAGVVVALAVSIAPHRADACQYIRTSMFQLASNGELVAVVRAGKLADDGTQELVPTKVIKHARAVHASLRVKTMAICDVSFEEGKLYLVVLDERREVLGHGNGLAIAPSAELIAAMERWVVTPNRDEQLALLRRFVNSADPKVVVEAKVLLDQWSPPSGPGKPGK